MTPVRCTERETGASLFKDRCVLSRVSRQRPGMKHELPARPARALVGGTSPLIGAPETFALLATSDMSGKTEVAALERHVRCTSRADIVGPSRHVRIVPTADVDANPPIGSYGQQADQSVYAVWKFGSNVDPSNQLLAIAPL